MRVDAEELKISWSKYLTDGIFKMMIMKSSIQLSIEYWWITVYNVLIGIQFVGSSNDRWIPIYQNNPQFQTEFWPLAMSRPDGYRRWGCQTGCYGRLDDGDIQIFLKSSRLWKNWNGKPGFNPSIRKMEKQNQYIGIIEWPVMIEDDQFSSSLIYLSSPFNGVNADRSIPWWWDERW